MSEAASSDVVDFDEAIAYFRGKLPVSDDDYEAMDDQAKAQAFHVAGVAQLDIASSVYGAIDEALSTGLSLEDFRELVRDELDDAWGGTVSDPGFRIETIFRTNVQTAYAAGRYAQLTDPEVLEDRPYWTMEVIDDGRDCEICEPCIGVVLPASDPWWSSHHVPLHFNCRCETHSLSEGEAKKRGIDAKGPPVQADDGFGVPPGLNKWAPRATDYPADLWKDFEAKQAHAPKPAPPKPAPPAGLRAGTHVANVTVARGVRNPPNFLGTIQDPELVEVLAKHPVTELQVVGKPRKGNNGAFTWHRYPGGREGPPFTIQVATDRAPGSFGKPFVPGSASMVSHSGATAADAALRTFVHELGHHIHFGVCGQRSEPNTWIEEAFQRGKPITTYAQRIPAEYFAECFAAYHFERAALRAQDPEGFVLVERVLAFVKANRR